MQQGQPGGQNRRTRNTIQCDCLYFVTRPSIIKIVQVISSLIGFSCLQTVVYPAGCGGCIEWFQITAMSGSLLSSIFLILYYHHIVEQFDTIPWLEIEFISSITWTIFNLSTAARLTTILEVANFSSDCGGYAKAATATVPSAQALIYSNIIGRQNRASNFTNFSVISLVLSAARFTTNITYSCYGRCHLYLTTIGNK